MICPYCKTDNALGATRCAACTSWMVERPPVREWTRAREGRLVGGVARGLSSRFGVPVARGFAYITDRANWPAYWPGLVRIEPGSSWSEPGDETRLVVKLLGREVELRMTLTALEQVRLVEYTSVQAGLPDARHERHFRGEDEAFEYRLVVEYEPRTGPKGLYDRVLVRRGIDRALERTIANLEQTLPR